MGREGERGGEREALPLVVGCVQVDESLDRFLFSSIDLCSRSYTCVALRPCTINSLERVLQPRSSDICGSRRCSTLPRNSSNSSSQ